MRLRMRPQFIALLVLAIVGLGRFSQRSRAVDVVGLFASGVRAYASAG